ncbi:MAG TPA: contractile injection system protein, VgrG/Pvc8 family [Pseudohaliea sp.]|nr:contractile injection system protein, VgrG/Pvc8 family [Pseudohaliea sp.]
MSTRAMDIPFVHARPILRVDGEPRPALGEAALAAQLRLPLAGMATCELRLLNWGTRGDTGEAGFQFEELRLGADLELSLGEQSEAPAFSGQITGIEERYGDGAPQLVLLAEDALHRLARQRSSRVFEDQSIDDVVRALADDAGLDTDVSVSSATASWHQLNESALAFLLRLTAPHDVAPRLEDGTLRARDEESDPEPVALDPGRNVLRLRLLADLNRQPRRVAVSGHALSTASDLEAESEALSPAPDGTPGYRLLEDLGWEGDSPLPHPAPRSQAEADALAERGLRHRAGRFLHGEVLCRGQPELRSGREIELSGVSQRLAGRYRVVDCSHRFDGAQGFTTRIKITRAFWND